MDAPPLSSERRRELAALRTRAYGPDADIDRDADALARLIELEELSRTEAPEPVGTTPPATQLPTGETTTVVLDEAGAPVAPEQQQSRTGRRRIPIWAYVVVALAIGLIAGLAVPALSAPHPTATLQQ